MVILKGSFIQLKAGLTGETRRTQSLVFDLFSFDSAIARQGLVLS